MVREPKLLCHEQKGFSLLELIFVVVIIGIVSAMGIKYFMDAMDRGRAAGMQLLAWRFAQHTSIIHAWRTIPASINPEIHGTDNRGVKWVRLDGVIVYLNEKGWPATTDVDRSPVIGRQTAKDCEHLLNALFKEPVTQLHRSSSGRNNEYDVFAMNGRVCRYQLAQIKDDDWFFDYNLDTGEVSISLPDLKFGNGLE